MPVAIPTIISAVATSARVGTFGVPREEIREETAAMVADFKHRQGEAEDAAGGAGLKGVRVDVCPYTLI